MWDKHADRATQVRQSVQTSLVHLRIKKLDALVMHWPNLDNWTDTEITWRAMEALQRGGLVGKIGISHTHSAETLQKLLEFAEIEPAFVQNPMVREERGERRKNVHTNYGKYLFFLFVTSQFAGDSQWDREIREICRDNNIIYQAYSLNHPANDWVYHDSRY